MVRAHVHPEPEIPEQSKSLIADNGLDNSLVDLTLKNRIEFR